MGSILAIVSKKVFEKDCPGAALGGMYPSSEYHSTHKGLQALSEGGDLYLVTARPGEQLWLVGVLRQPKKTQSGWSATNETPMIDITALRAAIQFESGKGISQKKGALGMSLQTPRVLSAADLVQLESCIGGRPKKAGKKSAAKGKADKAKADKKTTSVKATNEKTTADALPESPKETRTGEGPLSNPLIHYSDEARKHLIYRTLGDIPAKKRKSASRAKLWREWAANRRTVEMDPVDSVGFEKQAQTAQSFFLAGHQEPENMSIAQAAILLASRPGTSQLVAYLVARFELDEVVEIVVAAHSLGFARNPPRFTVPSTDPIQPMVPYGLFTAYLLAEPAAQARYRSALERAYADASLELRIALVGCTFERPEWADEVARDLLESKQPGYVADLLAFRMSNPELCAEILKSYTVHAAVVNLVPGLEERAVPLLATLLEEKGEYPNEQKSVARSLSCIGTPESAAVLVSHLRKKNVRPYAIELFAQFPHLAEDALSKLAAKKTKLAGVAREILENVARAGAAAPVGIEVADDDEVPEILRNPPWHTATRSKRKLLTAPDLLTLEEPSLLHWPEHSRRTWMAEHYAKACALRSDEDLAKFQTALAVGEKAYLYANYPADITIPLLADPPANLHVWSETPEAVLGCHGQRGLKAALRGLSKKGRLSLDVLLHLESPMVADNALGHFGGSLWMEKFPSAAIEGLVPIAVRKKSQHRARAETALRHLARRGHTKQIQKSAKAQGAKCQAAVEELLAVDPRSECPTKAPKMPPFYRPAELRPPLLKNGKALPLWAVERLGEMLRFTGFDFPYIGIEEVRDACEPRSLAEYSWDVAQAWDSNGGKETHKWMLHAVFHFGDDDVVRRLTPALRGGGIASMLGHIGTDAACMELQTIAARMATLKSWPKYAFGLDAAQDTIAARRGVTQEALEDRYFSISSVNQKGEVHLEIDGDRFTGCFNTHLDPLLVSGSGDRIRSFPRAAKAADPKGYEAALARWKEAKEDVAALVHNRASALERAMVDQRGWSPEEFRRVWVDPPLVLHFARATVWHAVDVEGHSLLTFRIAEDLTYSDATDATRELPAGTHEVCVAHPGAWTVKELEDWKAVFSDYELLSPFAQLARVPQTLGPDEQSARQLSGAYTLDHDAILLRLNPLGWHGHGELTAVFPHGLFMRLVFRDERALIIPYREGRPCTLEEAGPAACSEASYVLKSL